jgi:hypothetical protein
MTAKINFMASAIMISSTYLVGYYSNQIGKNLAKYKSDITKEELMTKRKFNNKNKDFIDYKYS